MNSDLILYMRSKWQSFVISLSLPFEVHSHIIWSSSIITTSTSILQVICIFWKSIGLTWPSNNCILLKIFLLFAMWRQLSSWILGNHRRLFTTSLSTQTFLAPAYDERALIAFLTVIRESIETDMVELTLRAKRKPVLFFKKLATDCNVIMGVPWCMLYDIRSCMEKIVKVTITQHF